MLQTKPVEQLQQPLDVAKKSPLLRLRRGQGVRSSVESLVNELSQTAPCLSPLNNNNIVNRIVAIGCFSRWPKSLLKHTRRLPTDLNAKELQTLVPAIFTCAGMRAVVLTGTCTAPKNHTLLTQLVLENLPKSNVVMLNFGEVNSSLLLHLAGACANTSSLGHVYVSEHYISKDTKHALIRACRQNRETVAYKRLVTESLAWKIATNGGVLCFWNLCETSETFEQRRARYQRDVEKHLALTKKNID
jgi:hypothetical protein